MTDSPTGSGLTLEREQEIREKLNEFEPGYGMALRDLLAEIDRLRAEQERLIDANETLRAHVTKCGLVECGDLVERVERLREAGDALDRALAEIKAEVEALTVDEPPEPMIHRVIVLTYAREAWRVVVGREQP